MSTKAAQKPAEEAPTTALATAPQGTALALPDDMLAELAGMEDGAGTSGAADDNIVPFLMLLQDISPQVKKRDAKYVEGAEAGLWLNKATGELMAAFDFQPCAYNRVIMEWVPRDAGGGVVGRHPMTHPSPEATMAAIGGKEVPDNRDSTGRKTKWITQSGNDLIDTRYQFGHIVGEDGSLQPAVISFSSTGHGPAREFMTMQRNKNAQIKLPDGSFKLAPAWARKYRVSSTTRSNNQGEWFVPKFEDLGQSGWITDAGARAAGKALYESVSSGKVQAANEDPDAAPQTGGNTADNDIPI